MEHDRVREEDESERRELEAARLDVSPAKPGEDPPTYGDEGGGNPFPEGPLEEPLRTRRPTFFQRLLIRLRRGA
jgi:hypothetical protein